eukprot:4783643-Lingulodinium_polyedra.AAC.1
MGPLTVAATRPVLCCGLPRRWLSANCGLRHAKSPQSINVRPWQRFISSLFPSASRTTVCPSD